MATARWVSHKNQRTVWCAFFHVFWIHNKGGPLWAENGLSVQKALWEQTIDNLSQKQWPYWVWRCRRSSSRSRLPHGRRCLSWLDNDTVDITNLNWQLFATADMVDQSKMPCCQKRLLSINPDLNIICYERFFLPENSDFFDETGSNFRCDRYRYCKTVSGTNLEGKNIPLISCLGTGNRVDPSLLRWGDISETSGWMSACPRDAPGTQKRGVEKQTVIYSVGSSAKAICAGGEEHGPLQSGKLRLRSSCSRLSDGKCRYSSSYQSATSKLSFNFYIISSYNSAQRQSLWAP